MEDGGTMKTRVEIRVRLKLKESATLHGVLSRFARETKGWKFPVKESEDYERGHDAPAGFAVCGARRATP